MVNTSSFNSNISFSYSFICLYYLGIEHPPRVFKGGIFIKINWKTRFKNKTFLISFFALIISFLYKLLALFEIVPNFTENEMSEVFGVIVNILGLMGVVVDPTTVGLSDK